ncbi:S28 family serine protease [Pyxidicoccus caerfyrddinensis]|uniref:S28 family serine protease n=1 Tax=Pyxidicoccus caerfyrddinensis TaxID=2709663 RepID=UPI0013DBDFBD|nr:S28 family serine protease [Pyxidicoccus caerfyrddinensis]
MQKLIRRPFIALGCALALGLQACGGTSTFPEGEAPPPEAAAVTPVAARAALDGETDILVALRSIPGLTVVREGTTPLPGARFFVLSYDQPVDHRHPEGARFQQRLTLLHRATQGPMVLASTGYSIGTTASRTEPTFLLDANQLRVEHRFFGPSTPVPATWEHLTLGQAAADHHRIVTAFKALYTGKWVSTGASKGGMTSLYHRALYSNDVDATVAYVAPNSFGPSDPRYIHFLSRVGDAACRERIRDFQRDALTRRDELVPQLALAAAAQGLTFDFLGADKTFEFTILELPFVFWQYSTAADCSIIPTPGAPADEVIAALDTFVGLYAFSDASISFYAPYYFQAGTQLGSYRSDERHLQGLVHYPRQYAPAALVPFSLEPYPFDPLSVPLIAAWVKARGERILLVYGENDPWSTNAFDVRERNDAYRFFQPGGNHGSSISNLPEPERALALERLTTWAGIAPQAPGLASRKAPVPLSDEERAEWVRERRLGPPQP